VHDPYRGSPSMRAHLHRSLLAVIAVAAGLLLAACEVPQPPQHLSGPIAAPEGCPTLPDQIAQLELGGRSPANGGVAAARQVTAVDVWGRRAAEAVDPESLARFLSRFHGDYPVVAEGHLPSIGVDVEVRSDGALRVDLAELDAMAHQMLTLPYPDPRFTVLMDCYRRRILSAGELEGRTLRIYVPADPTTCFQGGQLTPRRQGGCDAIGVALPDTQLGPRFAAWRPASLRWPATIVIAPGQHSTHLEPVEERAALTMVHELMHFFDNEMGLRPPPLALREYEQRAYCIEQVFERAVSREQIRLPQPISWRQLLLPATADDERE
jgi:hypothetical protein